MNNSCLYITFTIITSLLHTLNAGRVIGYKEIKVEARRPLNDYKSPSEKIWLWARMLTLEMKRSDLIHGIIWREEKQDS